MTSHPREPGRSKIGRPLLAAGLTLSVGYAFGLFTFGGCGSSQAGFAPPADGQLPERVVEKLTECSKRGPVPLQPVKHTVAFDVFMDRDGLVDNVALRSSTFHLDEVEACMENALYAVSERAIDASLRRREPASPPSLSPEARTLLANPVAFGLGAVEVVIAVGFMVVTVVVFYQVLHNTQTHRPPPPKPQVDEPTKPEPPKPEPQTAGDPKTTDPPPPPPPPLPPPPKETCEENWPHLIRCNDPKIRWYTFLSEDAVFREIVRKEGKGLRKAKREADAQSGPCPKRGGFHTNVLRGGDSVASIVGCNCCDDASGKALEKQKATVVYK